MKRIMINMPEDVYEALNKRAEDMLKRDQELGNFHKPASDSAKVLACVMQVLHETGYYKQ